MGGDCIGVGSGVGSGATSGVGSCVGQENVLVHSRTALITWNRSLRMRSVEYESKNHCITVNPRAPGGHKVENRVIACSIGQSMAVCYNAQCSRENATMLPRLGPGPGGRRYSVEQATKLKRPKMLPLLFLKLQKSKSHKEATCYY